MIELDVSLKRRAIRLVDRDHAVVRQQAAVTHPEMILPTLGRWLGEPTLLRPDRS